jgi:hypothetical protein
MTGMHASHAERKDELHAFPSLSLQEEEIIPEHQTAKKRKKNKNEKHKTERKKNYCKKLLSPCFRMKKMSVKRKE